MSELPKGWVNVGLLDVCSPKQWKTISTENLTPSGYPIYGANGKIGFFSSYTHEAPTLLITCRGATCGSLNISDPFSYINGNAMALDALNKKLTSLPFMFYALKARGFQDVISGSAQPQITRQGLAPVTLPLPPLNEQRRIVAKLDSLFARSRRAREELERIPKLCDRYKQAILAAACSGRLTADWREQNSNIETASELLRRIQEESIQRKRQIKIGEGIADLFDLPESWKWVRLFDICRSITDGAHLPPPQTEEGVPFLTISNITTGRINFDKTRYVPESYYQKIDETRKPYEGDILYTVVGATYGTPVFINTKERFCFQRHIAILKPSLLIDSQYLFYTLKSHLVYKQATDAVTGTAQPTVPLSGLRPIKVPLPPLTEQKEIVRRLEELFQAIDVLWQEYQKASKLCDRLEQATLSKAFRGELVPQDPNDEPAAALLARLQAENPTQTKGKSVKSKQRSGEKS